MVMILTENRVKGNIDTMSLWIPNLSGRQRPIYRSIVDALAEDVVSGRLPIGARLPPHRDLAWRLGVTVGTVARAYAEAERRGLVSGEVGRGTFVCDPRDMGDVHSVHDYLSVCHLNSVTAIDMAINRPSGNNNAARIGPMLVRLGQMSDLSSLLDYQLNDAPSSFRLAGAAWVAREGVAATPEQVVLTIGGQQGILAVLGALSHPGDVILAEELTYPGLKVAATLMDRRIEGIAMDEQGLIPGAVDQALISHPGGVVYCMPTTHNPTTATMPLERRQALVDVVRRHGGYIVEDGIYSFLADDPPPPLWTFAPERTIYVTSLSKALAPGLRIGYAVAPEGLVPRILANVSASSIMVSPLLASLSSELIASGAADAALDEQKAEARIRLAIAKECLSGRRLPSSPSLHLWLDLPPPWKADVFTTEAYRRGVAVSPAASFATTRRVPEAIRVSISAPRDHDELRRGLEILARLLVSPPPVSAITV